MEAEAKTASWRRPVVAKSGVQTRAANTNAFAKADALAEALIARFNEPEWAHLATEATKAYVYGAMLAKRLREGDDVFSVVRSANTYVALRDAELDTTRQQMFCLLHLVYVGAGMKAQAERVERFCNDPYFAD